MTKLKHQGSVKEFFAKVRNDPKNYLQTGVSHRVIHSDKHYSSNDSVISLGMILLSPPTLINLAKILKLNPG